MHAASTYICLRNVLHFIRDISINCGFHLVVFIQGYRSPELQLVYLYYNTYRFAYEYSSVINTARNELSVKMTIETSSTESIQENISPVSG